MIKKKIPKVKINNPQKKTSHRFDNLKGLKDLDRSGKHFMGMLLLFAGFSFYAIASFFTSTSDYIDYRYASVLGAEGESDIPAECYACKEPREDYPQCDILWQTEVCPLKAENVAGVFDDVSGDHLNYEAITVLHDRGMVKGYDSGKFKPDNKINRAEFLAIISNAVDADFGGKKLADCFKDVQDQWFAVYACYAKENEWVKGYGDGSFGAGRNVTKAETIKMVFGAFDYEGCETVDKKPYDDVELSDWAAPYACQAKADKIIAAAGIFDGRREMSRGEVVQVIYNVMTKLGKF